MVDMCGVEEPIYLEAVLTPENEVIDRFLEDDITSAIDSLPEKFRLNVTLSDVERFSYREIFKSELYPCRMGSESVNQTNVWYKKLRTTATGKYVMVISS